MAATISRGASSPWTRTGAISTRRSAKRRPMMLRMSRSAAPVGDVTMPMTRGKSGSGRFLPASKSPSASSFLLSCSKASWSAAEPLRLEQLDHELVLAAIGVHVEPAEGQHLQAVLDLEAHAPAPPAEEHAAELGGVVLQREVGVAGRGRAQVADLALDPHRRESLLEELP